MACSTVQDPKRQLTPAESILFPCIRIAIDLATETNTRVLLAFRKDEEEQ